MTFNEDETENLANFALDIGNSNISEISILNLRKENNSILSINNVIDSLKSFQKAIYYVNYLNQLIDEYQEIILSNKDYYSTLLPIIEIQFIENIEYFWIVECNEKKNIYDNKCYLEWKRLTDWNNKTIKEIYITPAYSEYKKLLESGITKDLEKIKELKNIKKKIYYHLFISNWNNGLKLKITLFRKDILNPNSWITISSGIDLKPYIPNIDNIDKFSSQYKNLIQTISNEIKKLNNDDLDIEEKWSYINPINFKEAKCFFSKNYPQWNNQLITNCFVPSSNINIPKIFKQIITQLYSNYPNLLENQFAFILYNYDTKFYLSICKILKDNTFTKYDILINDFFENTINFNNDITISGSFKVETYDKKDIINSNPTLGITTFNNKVGINQEPFEVQGLLDIDNLSISNIIKIFTEELYPKLLYTYEVSNSLKNTILFDDEVINTILIKNYVNDIVIFKTPLKININFEDINFIHNNNNDIFQGFSIESLEKLSKIVNDIYKMSITKEIDFYQNKEQYDYIFSFVEILKDYKYNYLCSIKVIRKENYDNTKTNLFFIISFLNIEKFMIDKSYKLVLDNFAKKISDCNKLLNYSILLIYNKEIQSNLFNGKSIGENCFTTIIESSDYFRNRFNSPELYTYAYNMENDKIFFNELFPIWNGIDAKKLFLPNKDNKVIEINKENNKNYYELYGNKKEQNFVTTFFWIKDIKLSFVNSIILDNQRYLVGTGINLYDYIDLSLILKGDSEYIGNFKIMDINNNTIFQVDDNKKHILNMYKLGIGTQNPKTTLDINDSGLGDIINIINEMSKQFYTLNTNINKFRNSTDTNKFRNIVQTNFIDPNTNEQIKENIDNYIIISETPKNLKVEEHKFLYHWLYPNWENIVISSIKDLQNQESLDNIIKIAFPKFSQNKFFNNGLNLIIYNFTHGIRVVLNYTFVKDYVYTLSQGVNLQTFDLIYNNNLNIKKFFEYLEKYTFYLQYIVSIHKKINIEDIINYDKAEEIKINGLRNFPIESFKKYEIDINNRENITIYDVNFEDLSLSNMKKYSEIQDVNLKTKLMLFLSSMLREYKLTSFKEDDYGILHFEDNYNDFVSLFYCIKLENNILFLYSLELQLNNVLLPSTQIKGDVKISGDLYLNDANNKNVVIVDTQNKFVGVNSQEVYVSYMNNYTTTTDISFSKQNFLVKARTYPVSVVERINEKDTIENDLLENNYNNFRTFSTFTCRRTSELYKFSEMLENSKKIDSKTSENRPNAVGKNENKEFINRYHYGSDINFEIKDKENIVKELGNLSIGIESVTETGDVNGCFTVNMTDTIPDTKKPQQRQVLKVSNDSTLYVNKINLGGKILEIDNNGDLIFEGKKVVTL